MIVEKKMSEDKVNFISYEDAQKIVVNVVEEEHLHEADRRILTVYGHDGRELCWFDAEEVISEVGGKPKKRAFEQERDEIKSAAVEYVMHRIPDWCKDGDS
jgi:hypothetical protein